MENFFIEHSAECCKCCCGQTNIWAYVYVIFIIASALCLVACRVLNCIKDCHKQKLEHERLLLQSCRESRNHTNVNTNATTTTNTKNSTLGDSKKVEVDDKGKSQNDKELNSSTKNQ